MPALTRRNMVMTLFSEGLTNTVEDGYWMLVDAGDIVESASLHSWACKQDKLMQDEGLSPREYMAKYGRYYL